jgi:hypothetical protein
MARLVIDLPEKSPGCILFSGPGAAARFRRARRRRWSAAHSP